MNIALSADHRGSNVIKLLAEKLKGEGHHVDVLGDGDDRQKDYPEGAYLVAKAIAEGKDKLGILVCGTGIGMSIAANKYHGARAAVAHDEMTAQLSRSHNNANILCLSADLLGQRLIEKIVDVWLRTEFEGGRHARRIHKIEAIEAGKDPSTIKE